MAQITITVPDAFVPRILAAYRASTGNPAFVAADIKAELIERIKAVVRTYEGSTAAATAQSSVNSDVNAVAVS